MTEKLSTTVAGIPREKIEKLEEVAEQYGLANLNKMGKFERALSLAEGIDRLSNLLDDEMMKRIMFLQDNKLGFRTDKVKEGGYPVAIVKSCFIEATLRGLDPTGNQWNIIAANLYVTKEGFAHTLFNYPGLKDLKRSYGVPRLIEKRTVVDCNANWMLDGVPDSLDCVIPVITNSYSSPDQIIGKVERKLGYRIHCQISGSETSDFDERDETEMDNTPASSPAAAAVVEAASQAQQSKVVDVEVEPTSGIQHPGKFGQSKEGEQ